MSASVLNKIKQITQIRQNCIDRINDIHVIADAAKKDASLHSQFKARYNHINSIYESFEGLTKDLVPLTLSLENFDSEVEKEACSDFYNKFYDIEAIYLELFSTSSKPQSSSNENKTHVKLPKIELPKFDGNPRQWRTFIDMYNSLVHNNNSLSNVEKFNYLILSLKNQPLSLVKCNPLSEANYEIAYNSLINRYENTRMLATSHYLELENASKIPDNSASSQNLRKLVDTYNENLAALQTLGFDIDSWDFLLFNMLLRRLDSNTVSKFEIEHGSSNIPAFSALKDFVLKQCDALDRVSDCAHKRVLGYYSKPRQSTPHSSPSFVRNNSTSTFFSQNKNSICSLCKSTHAIYKCSQFLALSPFDRYNLVKEKGWCMNCLGYKHNIRECSSNSSCSKCGQRHHTLLHFRDSNSINKQQSNLSQSQSTSQSHSLPNSSAPNPVFAELPPVTQQQPSTSRGGTSASLSCSIPLKTTVLLSTVLIEILDSWGNFQKVRALLDSGSQISIISEKCCNRLGLPKTHTSLCIQGLNEMSSTSSKATSFVIRPWNSSKPCITVDAIVLRKVCDSVMPNIPLSGGNWSHLSNLKLADPSFNVPGDIDVLLGADIFSQVLEPGRLVGNLDEPIALNTILGWILMGKVSCNVSTISLNCLHCSCSNSIDQTLKRFWETEELPQKPFVSPEDELCEKLFISTVSRDASGRFTVSLPFRSHEPSFSDSKKIALRRFHALERKLHNNPSLFIQYSDFMKDYLEQGHMSLLVNSSQTPYSYYIPHHCVVRPDSATTKLRVVFDASAQTSDGISLNNTLLTGPKLQLDIVSLLLQFRIHPVVLTADIRQMYRQILVAENHRDYQRILWRFSSQEPVKEYILNTVTYGVSSAPFLAIRTLLQLADEEKHLYPLASRVVKYGIYVDDIVTGCNSLQEAQILKAELISLFKTGGFELHKWNSNSPSLLSDSTPISSMSLDLDKPSFTKILGLKWHSTLDVFSFDVSPRDSTCTKRTILSELARIFDPLGFLSPLTLFAKRLIQTLWTLGLKWDDAPPPDIIDTWIKYKSELSCLSEIHLPRCLFTSHLGSCELHGFSDASEKGCAAVIYLRFCNDEKIGTRLVCAKSKVSPLKRLSIPRLELCAAVLLADLLSFVLSVFKNHVNIENVFAWSDSTITLSWIRSQPHRWKTFVSNRVTRIHEKLSPDKWHYVSSSNNPADCASRGLLPLQLFHHSLWWAGPSWLVEPSSSYFDSSPFEMDPSCLLEEKRLTLTTMNSPHFLDTLLEKFSSISKIQRIIAYISRFCLNTRSILERRVFGSFSLSELDSALLILVKHVQHQSFSVEMSCLNNKKSLPRWFAKLNPFLDTQGFLRVGSRLAHSKLLYDKRFPFLLPSRHKLTELIIEYTHKKYLHPGYQALHFLIGQRFWILSARKEIRRVLSRCYNCWKLNPVAPQPQMGDLPPLRVSQLKPFSCVGVDYGGPYLITLGKFRGVKTYKAYICLFVCFATKALHLELATDLSSDTFLAALRRFISRRGRCSYIFSDCGTNFTGAAKQLSTLMKNAAENEALKWHFNPPSSPHFGGLWEAGIKSVKTHISRVIGEQILTYEEFNTLLIQIEGVLNSRPLCPASSDPNDLSALTPGHFLTLEPLNSLPDDDLSHLKLNRLSRWQLVQRLHKDFWSRWSHEYLHTMHQRNKWNTLSQNLTPGTLVLIKNDLLPPLRWQLARIVDIHPGSDGKVRVVTLRTNQGVLKRPVVKVCPLPLDTPLSY